MTEPETPDDLLALGSSALDVRAFEQALQYFTRAAELHAEKALFGKGVALAGLDRFEEALTALDAYERVHPDIPEVWQQRGEVLMRLERFAEALTAFEHTYSLKPDLGSVLSEQAVALSKLGRHEESLPMFRRALEADADDTIAWRHLAVSLYRLGHKAEALDAFGQALQRDGDDAEALRGRGILLFELGRSEEALAALDEALTHAPDDGEAWECKGRVLASLGHLEESVWALDEAIRIHPTAVAAIYNRGVSLYRLKQFDESLKAMDEVIRLCPDYAEAHYTKAVMLLETGKHSEGLDAVDQALLHNSGDPRYWHSKGVALLELGRKAEARTSLKRALEAREQLPNGGEQTAKLLEGLEPGSAEGRVTQENRISTPEVERMLRERLDRAQKELKEAIWGLVSFYSQVGRPEQAQSHLDELLAASENAEEKAFYYLSMGQLMEQKQDFEAAVTWYRQAFALEPSRSEVWYLIHNNLGYSLNQVGEFSEGEQYCRRAIEIDSARYNAYKNLGIALEGQGQFLEAAHAYLAAVKAGPNDQRALGHLRHLLGEHPDIAKTNPELGEMV